jgi:hypothetical protein
MRIISHVFAGAGTVDYNIGGRYLRLIQTASPVDIVPLDSGREMIEEKATAVEAGFATRPLDGFDGFRLTSSVAQTVRLAVTSGSGSYDRLSGDVTILGGALTDAQLRASAVPVSGPLTDAQLRATAPRVRPVCEYTNSYVSDGAAAGPNTAYTIFTPAANANGAIVWNANYYSQNAAAPPKVVLVAHASAPGAIGTGDTLCLSNYQTGSGATGIATLVLPHPVFIPAGKGLYFLTALAEAFGNRQALYSLL